MVLFQHHHLEHKYILWLCYLHSGYDSADIGITTDTTSNLSSACIVFVGCQNCQPCPMRQQQTLRILLNSFQISGCTYHDCNYSLADASRSLTQLCILCHSNSMAQACYQALQISASLGTCILHLIYQGNSVYELGQFCEETTQCHSIGYWILLRAQSLV